MRQVKLSTRWFRVNTPERALFVETVSHAMAETIVRGTLSVEGRSPLRTYALTHNPPPLRKLKGNVFIADNRRVG